MKDGVRSLEERLDAASRRQFVGRSAELELFRAALQDDPPPFAVLHVHGPGGIGKTTLLREFARLAVEANRAVVALDARYLEITPAGVLHGLCDALGLTRHDAFPPVDAWPERTVLLLDTFELLAPLDAWLRDVLLPQLPERALVVIAGRGRPSADWRADSRWAAITRIVPIDNLDREASAAFLSVRGVPVAQQGRIVSVTRGHPLALALAADAVLGASHDETFHLERSPELVNVLMERMVERAPDAEHRQALAVAAIAYTTTEGMLAEVLGPQRGAACFEWLRGLTFMQQGTHGLFPHALVRDVLDTDLRWRDPDSYWKLQRRVLAYLERHRRSATGSQPARTHLETMFAHRHHPGMKPYFAWETLEQAYAESLDASEAQAVVDMVRRHEGEVSARIAAHWLAIQPGAFLGFRDADGSLCGFMANLELHGLSPADHAADPGVRSVMSYIERSNPLSAGDAVLHLRFWMDSEDYHAVSPAINLTAAHALARWLTHPRLAWSFVTFSNPDFWAPHFESVGIARAIEADFEVDGRRYGLFAHDWRAEPVAEWQAKRRAMVPAAVDSPASAELPREAFDRAVRQALRDYTRTAQLAGNPLLACIPSDPRSGQADPKRLQALLREALASLEANPKDLPLHRALWHTYFEPEATQERVAELLDLPFSTYRYHLTRGIGRISDWLRHHARSR